MPQRAEERADADDDPGGGTVQQYRIRLSINMGTDIVAHSTGDTSYTQR
jgi:hypothetical protein